LLEQVLNNPNSSVEEKVVAIIATLEPGEAVTLDILLEAGLTFADLPPETPVEVRTDENGNPVIIDAQTASSLALLKDPRELASLVFTDPMAVVNALLNIGKDMSPEERKESQAVVVASVVVGNIAGLASPYATSIGVVPVYRRKP
jgi:hypothetical protein